MEVDTVLLRLNELSAEQVKLLMRCHRVTIRALAQRMNITMKRVRQARATGVYGHEFVADWWQGITGESIYVPADRSLRQ